MKIKKRRDKETTEFWKNTEKAQKIVEQWPEWKRNVYLSRYSSTKTVRKPKDKK